MLRRVARPRVLIYGALLGAAITTFAVSLWQRPDFRVDIVRDRAALARVADDGAIENVYQLHLVNATERPCICRWRYRTKVIHAMPAATPCYASSRRPARRWRLAAAANCRCACASVLMSAEPLRGRSSTIGIDITAAGNDGSSSQTMTEKSTFFVPR